MWPSTGAIIFSAIGAIVVLAIIVLAINYFANKKFRKMVNDAAGKLKDDQERGK